VTTPDTRTPKAAAPGGRRRWQPLLATGLLACLLAIAAPWPAGGRAAAAEKAAANPSEPKDAEAARQAKIARQMRLQEAQVLAARGRKLAAAGANAEAREALREAVRLNPGDAASRKLLSQVEAALGITHPQEVLAHTRERHAFKSLVLRQQVQLDLFEAEKALGEQDFDKAAQRAERALQAISQVDDASSAAELRERAQGLLAKARVKRAEATVARRQKQLDRAKAEALAERTKRIRAQADGLRALHAQALKLYETGEYDKALTLAEDILRNSPQDKDALALREKIRQASTATLGPGGKSRKRREAENDLMADIERELTPLKPNVVMAVAPNRPKPRSLAGPKERWELELRSKLASPVTMEFRETPIAQAIEQLSSVGGVNIIVDPDMQLDGLTVSIPRAQMPLESMVRWVARFGKMRYCLRDGAVYLTGRAGALDAPVTRIYDIATLLSAPTTSEPVRTPGPIEPGPRLRQVVEATSPDPEPIGQGWVQFIRASIAPETWQRSDVLQANQPYTIQYRNGRIVVVHTPEVQKQIENLLNDFRKARSLQVHMQGRFISIERKFLDSLNLSFSYDSLNSRIDRHTGEGETVTSVMSPTSEVPSLAEFDNYSISGGLVVRCSLLDDESLVMLLRAVVHEGKGTVLESPRLTCYNTQRANIQVLRNRNYVRRVSSDFTPEIGNIPEGTIFDIQPFVSADRRYITLVCQPQMRTFVSFTTFTYGTQVVQLTDTTSATVDMTIQLPTTTLRSVGTTVTVPNGGTILMGGFTTVQEWTGVATAPFIEGIPLLSYLLRARDHIEGRRSLIMLITAETVEDIFEE